MQQRSALLHPLDMPAMAAAACAGGCMLLITHHHAGGCVAAAADNGFRCFPNLDDAVPVFGSFSQRWRADLAGFDMNLTLLLAMDHLDLQATRDTYNLR